MQNPVQITFRNMESSAAVEAEIREKADKLNKFFERILGCRVVVESPHHHHRQGNLYHVRIDLTLPQGEIVVRRDPSEHHSHEDVLVAIRDAFDAAKRQLQDYVRRHHTQTKPHEKAPTARVLQLFPIENYGILVSSDEREIYFHRNSVLNQAFDSLNIGSEVRFVEEMGEKGPQASTVYLA